MYQYSLKILATRKCILIKEIHISKAEETYQFSISTAPNYQTFWPLKWHIFVSHSLVDQKSSVLGLFVCSYLTRLNINISAELCSSLEAQGKNLFSSSFKLLAEQYLATEVRFPCWLSSETCLNSQGPPRAHL